ncbi:type II toxin-antitoxin system VapC family toxin [Haloferax volcanii]|nr:PIN domain-containing protein [Haloferax volcanii]MBS8118098.1 PIN domain-containing protein [Haloferax volcanii]MBS8123110.1 PIN domain-containing protein [Haloferax volcanii]MBS8126978.1 PIN domain-containing protein [Haloferax volcanii]MBS8130844.1 PIN domain-containing protein [Haloferax volcanii]MDW7537132.1 PIN domain-containing protein [Haloferax volcanii]
MNVAETDFLLALIKDEDWLGDAAEAVYRNHRDELWTSQFTLIELLMVAYREERDTERVITNVAALLEVRGDVDTVLTAATYVEDHGFTPFDALHLVESDGDTIVSSDETYESFAPRLDLKTVEDE